MPDIDCEYTREIVCPYCGYEHQDSWEADDQDTRLCGSCEREFKFTRDVDVTYISEKIEEAADGNA